MRLSSSSAKITKSESALTIATQEFIDGRGRDDYIKQLQIIVNLPNNAKTDFERGVIEGHRRFCITLINISNQR